jgi:hypothetical protein
MARNADKSPLSLVDPTSTGIPPPRQLGQPGLNLWNSIQDEFRIDDAGGIEMLAHV